VTTDAFVGLRWRVTHPDPVVRAPALSPIIADPTFLLPHETPDARWHLVAHSIWGLHHFTSSDGIRWSAPRLLVRHAMRPFLVRDGATYHLFYERYPAWRLPLSWLPGLRWRSWIERRSSSDLAAWSDAVTVLHPVLGWHRAATGGEAVGNPCVVRLERGWALYYSASLVLVPDCGFTEPLHVGVARAGDLAGPWRPDPEPVLSPRADDARCNLGAGALKVLRLADGFVGLQNGITLDRDTGRSRSAISVRTSSDGVAWRYAHDQPIVAPDAAVAWRRRYVYACDCRMEPGTGRWYLYFNGRDHAAMAAGREAIGFVVGSADGAPSAAWPGAGTSG
jgi:hypothetical protein